MEAFEVNPDAPVAEWMVELLDAAFLAAHEEDFDDEDACGILEEMTGTLALAILDCEVEEFFDIDRWFDVIVRWAAIYVMHCGPDVLENQWDVIAPNVEHELELLQAGGPASDDDGFPRQVEIRSVHDLGTLPPRIETADPVRLRAARNELRRALGLDASASAHIVSALHGFESWDEMIACSRKAKAPSRLPEGNRLQAVKAMQLELLESALPYRQAVQLMILDGLAVTDLGRMPSLKAVRPLGR